MNITKIFEDTLSQKYGGHRVEPSIYHVSTVIDDKEEAIQKHVKYRTEELGERKFDLSTCFNFYFGEMLEEETLPKAVNNDFRSIGFKTQANFRHKIDTDTDEEALIVGNADMMGVDVDKNIYIVEQKTANKWSFKNKKDTAAQKHLKQAVAYGALSNAEYVIIWYISKSNGQPAQHVIKHDQLKAYDVFNEIGVTNFNEYEEWLTNRAKEIHEEVTNRVN